MVLVTLLLLFFTILRPTASRPFNGMTPEEKVCAGTKNFSAVVLSAHMHRFVHTEKILNRYNFKVELEQPIPFDSQGLQDIYTSLKIFDNFPLKLDEYRKTFSNYATFRKAIESFVAEPQNVSSIDDWKFFFEDDIGVHPGDSSPICSIKEAMELARTDGIFYLGLCGPTCYDFNQEIVRGVHFKRCYGTCAHAFALTKWKAALILNVMLLLQKEIYVVERLYFDRGLYEYGKRVQPILTIGTNLNRTHSVYGKDGANETTSSPILDHCGLIYQDRKAFHTTIGRKT